LAVSLVATGCTLAPHYQRPASPVSGAFPSQGVYATQPATAAGARSANGQATTDIGWREFFVDPRLQRLVEIALKNNRDLRVAVLNVAASRAQYLSMLTAQTDLYSAQQSLINARLARWTNLVDLYRALGGGWIERAGKTSRPADQRTDYGNSSDAPASSLAGMSVGKSGNQAS
jgi:outer membrane protein TolC